jgi:acylphosphatase
MSDISTPPDSAAEDANHGDDNAAPDVIRLHAIIHGYVQGVSFRAYTQREATQRGITGWVTNNWDGTVETIAEGPRDQIAAFARWLQHGPRMATVDQVDATYSEATGEFSRFNIRY